MTKAKLSFNFHVEETLFKHIRSDPVQRSIYCQKVVFPHLHGAPALNQLIRLLRKTFLTHNFACRQTEKASNPNEKLMFISTVNIQCSFVSFKLFSHVSAAHYPNFSGILLH